jgi:hypothetical protein
VALPASAVVVLSTAIWFGWQWSRRSAISARTTPTTASDLAPCPPPYRHLPVVPQKGGDSADAKRALADQFALAADETRRRMERLKDLAPEFRADEVVHQMLEYRDAAIVFPAMAGETGFMSPERLSDAAFFAQIQTTPRLPAWFAQPQRDGYLFEFHGDDCTWRAHMVELGRLCFGFAYVARPVEAANRRRTYALFSADQRVHYRMDGAVPTQNDPTVDNSTVSAAANQNPPAAAALYEAEAIRDLQHVAKVQELVKAMIGRGYIAPEQLVVSGSFAGTKIPPMLPGTFAEQVRYGYRFEFTGTTPLTPGKGVSLGIPFDSFVYTATPQNPAPGRRTFALYPDGRIYATTDARLPTPQDPPVN